MLLGYEDFAKGRDAEAAKESYAEFDEYYMYRGWAAHRLKKYRESIADADRATALKPWDPEDPNSPIQRTLTQLQRDWGALHADRKLHFSAVKNA